jgi:hypothetical protein
VLNITKEVPVIGVQSEAAVESNHAIETLEVAQRQRNI